MKIGAAFPSKYLRAADIPDGRTLTVTMDRVVIENVAGNNDPDDEKPVLYFQGKHKGMVLNKTNSNTISAIYGDETEEWHGGKISLYAAETTFQGKQMPCLRVKADRNGQAKQPAPAPSQRPQRESQTIHENPITEDDAGIDDIPFKWMDSRAAL